MPARAAEFDVDWMHCGAVSCAYVYQGQGVDHPQLIAQIWDTNQPLFNATLYRFIYDFPEDSSPTISLYINNSLAHRTGPSPVSMSQEDWLDFLQGGVVLLKGLEHAFNGPGTYHLGFGPTVSELQNIINKEVELVPDAILQWDIDNGNIDRMPTGPREPGGTPGTPGSKFSESDHFVICDMWGGAVG